MKRIFLWIGLILSVGLNAQVNNKLIFQDNCENGLPNIPCAWCTSKYVGWTAWTAGTQDLFNQAPTHTLKVLGTGEEGAPAPREGTKSYQLKITRMEEYFGTCCQWTRNELKWGDGCGEFTDAQWFQISMYLPPDFCDDQVPIGMLYDMKFGDAVGPASFGVKVEDGIWYATYKASHSSPETSDSLFPTYKGVWVDFVCHRNFKDDNTGFINLYRHIVGVDNGLQLVSSRTGPNYMMQCGPQSETYIQNGLYKWAWQNSSNQGEGPSSPCGYDPIIVYVDKMKFWTSQATLADLNADVSGGTPGNLNPVVNAGVNQTITTPDTDAVMSASASDADGTIVSYLWEKVSGPAGGTISNAAVLNPTITALQLGTYVYRLTVTDDDDGVGIDEMQIVVQDAPVVAPPSFTNAGGTVQSTPDMTTLLPQSTDTLVFYATDNNDGYIQEMHVLQLSGPSTLTVNEFAQSGWRPTQLQVSLGNIVAGTYSLRLQATDNDLNTSYDTITLNGIAADNLPPTVNAGTDQFVPLDGFGAFQTKSVTLTGTASDADGSIASVAWQVLSGPENSSLGSPTSLTTTFASLVGGEYVVRLRATDNSGTSSFDTVKVTVLTCDAGGTQTISAASPTINLAATAIRTDLISSVSWTKVSGGAATIQTPTSLNTVISGLAQGTYLFQIDVTYSNGFSVKDQVQATVTAINNKFYIIKTGN